MKILIPYFMIGGLRIEDSKVAGGIEMFLRKFNQYIDNVVLLPITTEERRSWKKVFDKVAAGISIHKPDIIMANYASSTLSFKLQENFSIPGMWVCHQIAGTLSSVGIIHKMNIFIENGGSLFMVSKYQYDAWNALSKRICKKELKISGYITPSVVDKLPKIDYNDKIIDCGTIGRGNLDKHPFLLHERLISRENLSSLVISNQEDMDYFNKNTHWHPPKYTMWNVPHDDLMREISFCKTFLTTWVDETFGIVSLEALSMGIPVILNSKNNAHASECIPADSSHFIKVSHKKSDKQQTIDAIEFLSKYDKYKRKEIAEKTFAKHNPDAWKKHIYNSMQLTIENYKPIDKKLNNDLMEFFND